ncbi:MAG: aliphatic sulfonate ABC transporter substrate-binding protein [Candidatus Velthaea sp.]
MANLDRRSFLATAGAAALVAGLPRPARAAGLDRVALDYAYYNPVSLILKQNGWLEDALAKSGTKVEWVLSLGSNKANGYLTANAVQFGSTAGAAAFLARANGAPIKTVYLFSRPEWTALVVAKDSPIKSVKELKGKKIAATRGTDPWFFLLRSLRANGLDQPDVEIVDLQHPDGRTALERGQVDAWAGLDPHMAASELDAGSRLLYRNVEFNTYGALNAREDFLAAHPDVTAIVLQQYDRARKFAIAHPDETAKILAEASKLEVRVATVEVRSRTAFPNPAPGKAFADALSAVAPIIRAEKLVPAGTDLERALATLVDIVPVRTALRG